MKDSLLLGLWRSLLPVPPAVWKGEVSKGAQDTVRRLGFMSEEHHLVRDLVVQELPRLGQPLSPKFIAQELRLPQAQVVALLDELEKNMTFLFRNQEGAVTWAYPVTIDPTPHRVTFSTGEQVYAA